jgi:hypothetical protein
MNRGLSLLADTHFSGRYRVYQNLALFFGPAQVAYTAP